MARIGAVREDHLKRAGYLPGEPSSPDAPAIVWLSYNVHGNESVSAEAAMQVADFLLSPEAQARKQQPQVWGDPTVLDLTLLTSAQQRAISRSSGIGASAGTGSRIPSSATRVATSTCDIPSNGTRAAIVSPHTTPNDHRSHLCE